MKNNPLGAALALRALYERDIPKTFDDLFGGDWDMTAYYMAKLIQEQTGMKFQGAAVVCEAVFPELFAEYWDKLAQGGR